MAASEAAIDEDVPAPVRRSVRIGWSNESVVAEWGWCSGRRTPATGG
jgi:hypothetical protein